MIRCPINRLLVTIDKKYQDESGNLSIDTTYQPEEYATLKGIVTSIPDRVDNEHYKGEIEELVRIGDEVWFSYAVIFDYRVRREGETPEYKNLVCHEGEEYWKVFYEDVFCVVRDGKILIPTQHALLEPILQEEEKLASGLSSMVRKSTVYEDRARIVALPKTDISCKVGDIVPIEQEFLQKYIIFEKPHYILGTGRLIAKF